MMMMMIATTATTKAAMGASPDLLHGMEALEISSTQ